MQIFRAFSAVMAAASLVTVPSQAAPVDNYLGPNNGNWNNPISWSLGTAPNGSTGIPYDAVNTSANTIVHATSVGPGGVDTVNSVRMTGLGGLTLTGGTLVGALPNQGSTFLVGYGFLLDGGALKNFKVQNSDVAVFSSNAANLFQDVTLSGGLNMSTNNLNIPVYGQNLTVAGSFAYGAGATFSLGAGCAVNVVQALTLDNASIRFTASNQGGAIGSQNTLTLGSHLSVSGTSGKLYAGTNLVNNSSLISSPGGAWSLSSGTGLTNNSLIQATGSGAIYESGGTLINTGQILASNGGFVGVGVTTDSQLGRMQADGKGSVIQLGGFIVLGQGETLTGTNGGQFIIGEGLLDNRGKTVDAQALGNLQLFSGTINGGTVLHSGFLSFANDTSNNVNTLQDVTVPDGFTVGTSARAGEVTIAGTFLHSSGAVFNIAAASTMALSGTQTLDNALVNFTGYGTLTGDSLTLGSHLSLTGQYTNINGTSALINNATISSNQGGTWYVQGQVTKGLVNNGLMEARGSGSTLASDQTINAAGGTLQAVGGGVFTHRFGYTNAGTVFIGTGSQMSATLNNATQTAGSTQVDGTLSLDNTLNLQGGTLSGTGKINGSVINTGGIVSPGDSPGTLTFTGAYTQGASGAWMEEIGGTGLGQFDLLKVGGRATLGGMLNVALVNGYTPTLGQTFTFLNYGSLSGAFASVVSLDSRYGYDVTYGATSATLTVTSVSAAPELSGLPSLELGLIMLAGRRLAARLRLDKSLPEGVL